MGRRLRHCHGKKEPDLFASLPSEITIDILSRLPIRTIAICKSVCKAWLNLLRSRQFADFHLPKSPTGLVICGGDEGSPSNNYKVFEFDDDELDTHRKYSPLTKFNSRAFTEHSSVMQGSADGLILYRAIGSKNKNIDLYICNPITREYINLPQSGHGPRSAILAIGFGVSKISRQHKVVMVIRSKRSMGITKYRCLVYVLGTGTWRKVAPPARLYNNTSYSIGTPLNGNLHWLVKLGGKSHCISCFDLEKETFTTFSLRTLAMSKNPVVSVVVLGDLLSICQNTYDKEIFIWSMKEYGDEKSWLKEFVIKKGSEFEPRICCGYRPCNVLYPLKVFGDGDILMAYEDKHMVCYSDKNRVISLTDIFGLGHTQQQFRSGRKGGMEAMLHTSSLLSFRSFEKEKDSVRLF